MSPLRRRSVSRSGFTLIELLVVISIIALLSSVVLASLNATRNKARVAAGKQFANQAARAMGDMAVAIWDFDEGSGTTVADRSGFGNNGTFNTAGWTTDTYSGAGAAGDFNGSRRLTVARSDSFLPTDAISISVWVKPGNITSSQRLVSNLESGGLAISLNAGSTVCTAGMLCFQVWAGGAYKYLPAPIETIKEGEWQHVFGTYDGSNMALYVNGTPVAQMAASGALSYHATAPFCIGSDANTTACNAGNYLIGSLDEVRIFAKGFSASEVQRLFAEGAARRFAAQD